MALFDRFGRKKRAGRPPNPWWEAANEISPEPFYGPGADFGPVEAFDSDGRFDLISGFDPLGSYTGLPGDGGEPAQDADDL